MNDGCTIFVQNCEDWKICEQDLYTLSYKNIIICGVLWIIVYFRSRQWLPPIMFTGLGLALTIGTILNKLLGVVGVPILMLGIRAYDRRKKAYTKQNEHLNNYSDND